MAAALPVLEAVPDCADLSLTVAPYLPQFTSIPSAVFAAGLNASNLLELYANTNPLVSAIWFTILLAPVFLVVSEVNKNYSQVDRCWGLLPLLHNVHYTLWSHLNQLPSTLVDSVLAITSIWTVRSYSLLSDSSKLFMWRIMMNWLTLFLFRWNLRSASHIMLGAKGFSGAANKTTVGTPSRRSLTTNTSGSSLI